MKKIPILAIVLVIIFVIIFGFFFFTWYTLSEGDEYFEFRFHGIKIDKIYSSIDGPAGEFRSKVERRFESHVTVPENYKFYFTEKTNAGGGWESSRSFTIHMEWVDENGFSYKPIAGADASLGHIRGTVRMDVYKKNIGNLILKFKDYQGGAYNNQEDSAFEEPDFVDDIREQVKLVNKNPELTLAYMQTSGGSGFTTNFIFDDPSSQPRGGIFRAGATRVDFDFENEEMKIWYFP